MAKKRYIFSADIASAHPGNKNLSVPTDSVYAELANEVFDVVSEYYTEQSIEEVKLLALHLSLYLEDVVSQGGIWQAFTEKHEQLYNSRVPFFDVHQDKNGDYHVYDTHIADDYYVDEPNMVDAYFLIWKWYIGVSGKLCGTHNQRCLDCAVDVTDLLLDWYERIPANTLLRSSLLKMASIDNVYAFRSALLWFVNECFLTYDFRAFEWAEHLSDQMLMMLGEIIEPQLLEYTILGIMAHGHKVGPLALLPVQWLQLIMQTYDNEALAQRLANCEYRKTELYRIQEVSHERLILADHKDATIEIEKAELKLDDGGDSFDDKITIIGQFFRIDNVWYLVGSCSMMKKDVIDNIKADEDKRKRMRSAFNKLFGDKRLFYFSDMSECKAWLKEIMKHAGLNKNHSVITGLSEALNESTNINVFYDEDAAQLVVTRDIARALKAPDNPYYVEARTQQELQEDLTIIYNRKFPPSYFTILAQSHALDGILDAPLFDTSRSVQQRRNDLDLVARLMRQDYYIEPSC